jgi:hypothetical protein
MAKAAKTLEIRKLQSEIEREPQLPAGDRTYLARTTALYGRRRRLPPSRTLAFRLTRPGQPRPKSTVDEYQLGEAPEGFGKTAFWAADDSALALLIYLSTTDPLGVAIRGVKPTDTIEFVECTGIGSFAEETKNDHIAAFIGIVAAGGQAVADAYGQPEVAKVIDKADQFAEDVFKEEKVKTKRRDAFGEDPGTGHKAREEGGVIVSLPEARQLFYSGDPDHEERWIKEPGTRDDVHRPDHVHDAFFIRGGTSNKRIAGEAGSFLLAAWDYKFGDNFGFYRLETIVKRGSGKPKKVE